MILIYFFFGVVSWSAGEYFLHRFLGHKIRLGVFYQEHQLHHQKKNYFASSALKALAFVLVVPLIGSALSLFLPWGQSLSFAFGFSSMYLYYEWWHRHLHTHRPKTAYGRWARRHHYAHHFINPNYNHGVTTPLFDLILGTYRKYALEKTSTIFPEQKILSQISAEAHKLPQENPLQHQ